MIGLAPAPVIPPLSNTEYRAVRASIEASGILEPIVVAFDDPDGVAPDGEIVDGLNRHEIAGELGIPVNLMEPYELTEDDVADPKHRCPVRIMRGLTADDRRVWSVILNLHRRQLQLEQKREIVREITRRLEANPLESDRRIAALLGISDKTVARHRQDLEASGAIPATRKVVGGAQPHAATGASRALVEPTHDDDDEEEGSTPVAEHMRTGRVTVLYEHWAASPSNTRYRGALEYERERERKTRTWGPFNMPPEAQDDITLREHELFRQLHAAMLRDPLPRLASTPSE